MKKDPDEVGRKIRMIRESKGMTTEAFAEIFEPPASKGTVSKWENGKYLPNNKRLVKIAELGNVSVNDLLYSDWLKFRDEVYATPLQKVVKRVKNLTTFEDFLKSLGYQFELFDNNTDGSVEYDGIVVLTKDNIKTEFNLEEFAAFEKDIKDTVDFKIWQQNNY